MTSGSPSSTVCSEDAPDTVSSTDFASDESAGISTSRCAVFAVAQHGRKNHIVECREIRQQCLALRDESDDPIAYD